MGCTPKHTLSSHYPVLLYYHSIPGQLDHLIRLKDQRRPRQSNGIIHQGSDGRPEEVDTADSFDEKSSRRQLETHHNHSPNTKIIPTTKTSTTYEKSKQEH